MIEGRYRAWLAPAAFPVAALVAFGTAIALRVTGTSSALLWTYLYGGRDPHLLAGSPQPVRSDEWFVNTPLAMAQASAHFPVVNPHLGTGMNMSLIFDLPYRDWSLLLRPQQWGYAFLPRPEAFAFAWWLPALVLLLAVYGLVQTWLPGRHALASLLALGTLWSPFSQWWYTSTTLGSMGWGLLAAVAFSTLLRARTTAGIATAAALLTYACCCFALVLYPPFQIPVLLIVLAIGSAALITRLRQAERAAVLPRLATAAGCLAASAVVVALFAATRWNAVRAIRGTAYPGHRVTHAGGFSAARAFYGVLAPVLTHHGHAGLVIPLSLGGNLSEASGFLLIGELLLPLQVWLLTRGRRDPLLVGLLLVELVFLADLFLPAADLPISLLGLGLVPHARLLMGLGVLSLALLISTTKLLGDHAERPPRLVLLCCPLLTALACVAEVVGVRQISPNAAGRWQLDAIAITLAVGATALFAWNRATLGAAALMAFSLLSSGTVAPWYQGVFDTRYTPVSAAMRADDARAPGAWVSTAGLLANALMVESGVRTYSGTFGYPGEQWDSLDPSGAQRSTYNRYAHVVFVLSRTPAPLRNPQPDVLIVPFDPCGAFAQQQIAHVLAAKLVPGPCLRLDEAVRMPARSFYLYSVVPDSPGA